MNTKTLALASALLGLTAFADKPTFYLPGKIYAAPGLECSVYYKNILDSVVPQNYAFQTYSKVGRSQLHRWYWTPKEKDAGTTNQVVFNAWNDDGLVACLTTQVVVAKAPADPLKPVSYILFADSLTNSGYQRTIYDDLVKAGCSNVVSVGSRPAHPGFKGKWIPHEGIPGYTCSAFLVYCKVTEDELKHAEGTPAYELYKRLGPPKKIGTNEYDRLWVRSPLIKEGPNGGPVMEKDGTPVVDIPGYLAKYNGGKVPEAVLIQLGVNDVFWLRGSEESLRKQIRCCVMPWYAKFAKALRAAMPQTVITFTTQPLGTNQEGFGENYGADWNEVQHRKIMFALNKETEKFVADFGDPRVRLLSLAQAVDPIEGYCSWEFPAHARSARKVRRMTNAVHVSSEGGMQMADCMAAYLQCIWEEL